jgi:hypothetical protein
VLLRYNKRQKFDIVIPLIGYISQAFCSIVMSLH